MKKKTSDILRLMIAISILMALLMYLFFMLYKHYQLTWLLSMAITMMTVFYHFAMRLIVGETVTVVYRNRDFPQDKLGFKIFPFEKNLYKKLKVNKWKGNMITAKPEQFDINIVTPKELLHNIMQAELVHRIIMVLSFVPLLFIIPFGAPGVFIITSVLACLIDSVFVVIQRYNRPRVLRLMKFMQKRKKDNKISANLSAFH